MGDDRIERRPDIGGALITPVSFRITRRDKLLLERLAARDRKSLSLLLSELVEPLLARHRTQQAGSERVAG